MSHLVADLFSGLGGFTEGAHQAGTRVVFAANHWPEAVEWHSRRHPATWHECQDLQQFDFSELPPVDILIASPACQGQSTAGRPARAGTGGNGHVDRTRIGKKHQADRATAWAVVAACDSQHPPVVVVENVPDFTRWALFRPWLDCFVQLGYTIRVHDLDARDFGTPQTRRRCVVTASLNRSIDISPTLDFSAPWQTIGDCLLSDDGVDWRPVSGRTPRVQALVRKAQADVGDSQAIVNNVGAGVRGRSWTQVFPTVTTKSIGQFIIIDGDRCRMPTTREIARAQGFPDSYPLPRRKDVAGRLSVTPSRHH